MIKIGICRKLCYPGNRIHRFGSLVGRRSCFFGGFDRRGLVVVHDRCGDVTLEIPRAKH